MATWLKSMEQDPERIWSPAEAAEALGIKRRNVHAHTYYAVQQGALYRRKKGKLVEYSLTPLPGFDDKPKSLPRGRMLARAIPIWDPEGDMRVPQVVQGWKPPVMVPPRSI